jgi:putative DNA primase/helicase
MTLRDAALNLAELGYRISPGRPGQKVPATEHGIKDASADSAQVSDRWRWIPEANILLDTNELLVVDVDGTANPWLTDEPEKLADLAAAPVNLTPSGGRHYIFRQPEGRTWRNTASRIAANVDTRGNGGYIVVPPSTVDGKPYRWAHDSGLDVPPHELPEPPGWLTELLDEIESGRSGPAPEIGDTIPSGRRNAALLSLAGSVRRRGCGPEEIYALLSAANSLRCHPPLDDSELRMITESACRYQPREHVV